jgi:GNAT superfamily N-acetyltransferase
MGGGRLAIDAVSGRHDERAFVAFPYALYAADELWVAPLPGEERARWDERRNPALRGRWTRRYLARRDGRVVGRVAAIEDPAFAERWLPGSGFFGFFECADDPEAARGLLEAAAAALRGRGLRHALGPVNLSTHDEVGALVEGFDSPPMLLSPYNPRYLPALIEGAGYTARTDYRSYRWLPAMGLAPAAARIVRAAERGAGRAVTLRPVDPRRWDEECRVLHDLYNASFDAVWGFVPMSWDEFRARAEQFRPFLAPELVRVAEADGYAAGFGLALPDANEALRPLRGRLWPLGWLRLVRALPRVRGARFVLLGVRPGYTGRGIAVRLAAEVAEGCRRHGVRYGEVSLVREGNEEVKRVVAALGCTALKTYRLYEKPIDG